MFLSDRTLTLFARRAICAGTLLAALLLPAQSGCVERRMTVRTNPPGALVYVDDYEIGTTPVSTDFIYYGTRKIRIVKDGYETLTVMQPISTPWYEYPPVDFITENFVPGKIRDQRILDYQLKPQMIVPTDQLVSRAEGLRHANLVLPAGAVAPQPGVQAPVVQPGTPNAMPGTLPGTVPGPMPGPMPGTNPYPPPNAYPQPNTSIPPGASNQPNAFSQPSMLTPPGYNPPPEIGGQGVHPLPPR
ncbi:MAG: PEGA domain-containing protein [Thermoguttaceae bacterium]|jgi:hypothetical protein